MITAIYKCPVREGEALEAGSIPAVKVLVVTGTTEGLNEPSLFSTHYGVTPALDTQHIQKLI
ncbi:MAG: hypothetical protein PVF58_12225 [Candidatus Methanofastidiosia archaeon]|jgi:hypothetical protein